MMMTCTPVSWGTGSSLVGIAGMDDGFGKMSLLFSMFWMPPVAPCGSMCVRGWKPRDKQEMGNQVTARDVIMCLCLKPVCMLIPTYLRMYTNACVLRICTYREQLGT